MGSLKSGFRKDCWIEPMIVAFLKALRPKQWVKNLLLFAGIVFARRWDDPQMIMNAVIGFVVFCALSGVVYIVNDIIDVEQDRKHPKKCKRAIASGAISPVAAGIGGAILATIAIGYSFLYLPLPFAILAVTYFILVSLYSLKLKHAVVLDILLIALGFVLRALAGIEVIRIEGAVIEVTSYFLLTTLFLALFLAIAKRRNELVMLGTGAGSHRKVLEDYSTEFLDVMLTVATAGTLFSYALWTTQGQFATGGSESGNGNTYLLVLTLPFVLYGMFRYLWLVFKRDEGGAPELLLLEDYPLLTTVVLWMITVVAVLARLR
ncbi:decaprenyl-phosphate phosphoribosyltransferase [bacterium]|nr:decaprenyl-phosphate phosphoribosyltransferase [bacterium]